MGCRKLTYHQEPAIGASWEFFISGKEKTASTPIFCIDYYTFGMVQPNRSSNLSESRHLFNGMEHDAEVSGDGNSYTTQFRQYDPRLGRWKSLDPMMAKYPNMSPYVAFNNNPVFFVDPFGLEGTNPGGEPKTHTLEKGETLSGLSEKYGVSVEELYELNPDVKGREKELQIGEVIVISKPSGGRTNNNVTYYSAGAGHDEGNTGYIEETIDDMSASGISNPTDVESHQDQQDDAIWSNGANSKIPYYDIWSYSSRTRDPINAQERNRIGNTVTEGVSIKGKLDPRVSQSTSKIIKDIRENQYDGEISLMGYSTGSVIMAQTALYLANEEDIVISNLVLIGTTIANESELMRTLEENCNIMSITRVDIPGDNVSQGAGSVPSFILLGDDHPHFMYAFWSNAHELRMNLFKILNANGLK